MSCGCNQNPCGCTGQDPGPCGDLCLEAKANPNYPNSSLCNGDTTNNIWFTPGPPGYPGQCKLDTLTYGQIMAVLERVPCAKKDLLRITDDPCLVMLANDSRLIVPIQEQNQIVANRLMKNSIPFYTVIRGNIDGSII